MTGIPLLDELHLSTQFLVFLMWSILPTLIYVVYSHGLPDRNYWVPVVFILGWIGILIAVIWGPKRGNR